MLVISTSLVVVLLAIAVMGALLAYIIRTCTIEINEADREKLRANAAKAASESSAVDSLDGRPKTYGRTARIEPRGEKRS